MWEVSSIVNDYKNEFESCGLNINSNNEINLEESLILQAANDGDLQKIFSTSLGFIPSILNKSNEIMLNPMKYLDKTIVYYKDVTKPGVSNPYMTSIYSGMIFNSYC
jgi:flagellar hook-associated protein 2